MGKTRSQKAIINSACEIALEIVIAICSFILPKLIITSFGSAYNGITASIAQFIGCIALLKSGIGSVTRAALYKPLAEKDSYQISQIVNATSVFMKKIAFFFALGITIFACVYPLFVAEDFSWLFSFTLVLIIAIGTFAQYYFGMTYQMLIQADQRNYIISLSTIISTICNTILSVILINSGCGIHLVKLGSSLVFALPPIFYNIYCKKHYNIDLNVKPDNSLISQRWDAFGHQVANFVNQNTDVMVTTVMLGVKEVSVYNVYFLIGHAVQKGIKALSSGVTAAFGNMIAKKEKEKLLLRYLEYESLIYFTSAWLLSVAIILITPFIRLYTAGITDINYDRPLFGYLVCISIYVTCIKLPYEQLVYAAGEFKRTRNGTVIEACINLIVSIILAYFIGLYGILIGTIVALLYRSIRYDIFIRKNLLDYSFYNFIKKNLASMLSGILSFLFFSMVPIIEVNSYFTWTIFAIIVTVVVGLFTLVFSMLFYRNDMIGLFKLGLSLICRKHKKKS